MSNICCPYLHEKLFTRVQSYKLKAASWTHIKSSTGCRLAGQPQPSVSSLLVWDFRESRLWPFRRFWISSRSPGSSQGTRRNLHKHLPRCSCKNRPAVSVRTRRAGRPARLTRGSVSVTAGRRLWPLEDKREKAQSTNPKHFLSCYTTQRSQGWLVTFHSHCVWIPNTLF